MVYFNILERLKCLFNLNSKFRLDTLNQCRHIAFSLKITMAGADMLNFTGSRNVHQKWLNLFQILRIISGYLHHFEHAECNIGPPTGRLLGNLFSVTKFYANLISCFEIMAILSFP